MEAPVSYLLILQKQRLIFFSVEFNPIDSNDILDIHKYLMKKHNMKKCLG